MCWNIREWSEMLWHGVEWGTLWRSRELEIVLEMNGSFFDRMERCRTWWKFEELSAMLLIKCWIACNVSQVRVPEWSRRKWSCLWFNGRQRTWWDIQEWRKMLWHLLESCVMWRSRVPHQIGKEWRFFSQNGMQWNVVECCGIELKLGQWTGMAFDVMQ